MGHRVKLICRYDEILNDHWRCILHLQKVKIVKRKYLRLLFPFCISKIFIFPEKFLGAKDRVARADWCLKAAVAQELGVTTQREGINEIPLDDLTVHRVLTLINGRIKKVKHDKHVDVVTDRLENIEKRLEEMDDHLQTIHDIAVELKAIRDTLNDLIVKN